MTRELKEIARQEAPVLVKELIRLATNAESEAVRVAAIKELSDRGYGRSVQPIHGEMTYGVSQQLADLFKGNEGNTLGAEIARRAICTKHAMLAVDKTSTWGAGRDGDQTGEKSVTYVTSDVRLKISELFQQRPVAADRLARMVEPQV